MTHSYPWWSWPYYTYSPPYVRRDRHGPSPGCKLGGAHYATFLSSDCSSFQVGAHCCKGTHAVTTSCSRTGAQQSVGTVVCVPDDD